MLSDRIELILNKLHTDSKTVAEFAGISPAGLSRLRSGSRTYHPDSPTVDKFTKGLYFCTLEKGQLDQLCRIVGCPSREEHQVRAALVRWLFSQDAPPEPSRVPPVVFSHKLRRLMELARVSNSRMAKDVSIDPSYISRMRNGKVPMRSSRLVYRICDNLSARLIEGEKLYELADLLGISPEYLTEATASELLYNWLYEDGRSDSIQAVRALLDNISSYSSAAPQPQLMTLDQVVTEEILTDTSASYTGIDGLQKAVLRFLSSAALRPSTELWLYSDMDMAWLTGEFRLKWASLMSECIKRGVRIRIIHNVDRNPFEMLQAINAWLPLYMTGLIEPYYNTKKRGDRFTYTLFLEPGKACIESFSVSDTDDQTLFTYLTDLTELRRRRDIFERLMASSRSLVKMSHTAFPEEENSASYTFGPVEMILSPTSAVVHKHTLPEVWFRFTHPLMRQAIQEFILACEQEPKEGNEK